MEHTGQITGNKRLAQGDKDYNNKVLRLITNQLSCLLDVITLESKGEPVCITGYRISSKNPRRSYQELSEDCVDTDYLPAYKHSEPRLLMVAKLISFANQIGDFMVNDIPIDIDGFQLKNLAYWARYPTGDGFTSLGSISSFCDARCKFCFLKGSAFKDYPPKSLGFSEAQTRLKFFNQTKGLGLPVPINDAGDLFVNKNTVKILEEVRSRYPDLYIEEITTHGNHLTADVIAKLAELKPISVVVSLNSADSTTRARIMNSSKCDIGIKSIPLLRKHGIRFIGSIVPWKQMSMEDIKNTIKYLDDHEAAFIRIILPGFTRFSQIEPPFNSHQYWDELVQLVDSIRAELSTPIIVQPSWFHRQEITAHVDGVCKNSPAYLAGVRFGDRILAINNDVMVTRADANNKLEECIKEKKDVLLSILRKQSHISLFIKYSEEIIYPYNPPGYSNAPQSPYGLHFIDGFPMNSLLHMIKVINQYPEANNILVFTTPLGKSLLFQSLSLINQADMIDIPLHKMHLTTAEHRYWGGNIIIGDLHIVQDYVDHIIDLKTGGYIPDLILIPSSFTLGKWKLDVLGNSYHNIERETGCRVELIPTRPVIT